MKNTAIKTLGEVAEKVDELSKDCFDKTIPVKDISFDSLDTVNIGSEKHEMRKMAQRSFCYRLGTPHQYLRKCPVELQAENLNTWIKTEKNENLFFRFDGNDVRSLFTEKYVPIDNFEVLERIYALGYKDNSEVQAYLDDQFMSLTLLDGRKKFDINGDTFKPGISFSNSEIGLASLSIAAMLLRLVCTNGMISKSDVTSSHKHISGKVLDKFPEIIEKVAFEVAHNRDQFKLSLESPVDNPNATLESFNRQFALSPVEKDAVTWAWPYEEGNNMFSVVNCYTKASQYEDLSAASSFKLQKTGGQILSMLKPQ